jgi:hypothetical protein
MMAAGLTFREVATVCSAQKQQQGENLAFRSPPLLRLLSPHACQRISKGGLSRTLGNFQRDDQLTGWLQSPVLRVPEPALLI